MALIHVKDLSFTYSGSLQAVFQHVNLDLDTAWRLGLVGRNGRGKTTFMNLFMGRLEYQGSISTPEPFEYFPVSVASPETLALEAARSLIAPFTAWELRMEELAKLATAAAMAEYGDLEEQYAAAGGYGIDEAIAAEAGRLGIVPDALRRPFATLSGGEQVKLLLAALFLKKHRFLLIDEPTDHLDAEGRRQVARWLAGKSGFILVSHDRAFLDEAVDHILSINRANIELQRGNYSSWRHNRSLQDEYELAENRRLEKDMERLKEAAARTERWSDQIEKSKKAGNQTYNKGAAMLDRGHIGHMAAKMMKRSKAIERRRGIQIEEKQLLLRNVETAEPLVFHVIKPSKARLVTADALAVSFGARCLFRNLSFHIDAGERVMVAGANGCGKSSLLKLVLGQLAPSAGQLWVQNGITISSLPQSTDAITGTLKELAAREGIDESLFLALLRKLDFEREAFARPMESYSAGQKKKVLLAASLSRPAHLFVWDEPLNYIDVLSREQVEKAVLYSGPSLLFVEHDAAFAERVATKLIGL